MQRKKIYEKFWQRKQESTNCYLHIKCLFTQEGLQLGNDLKIVNFPGECKHLRDGEFKEKARPWPSLQGWHKPDGADEHPESSAPKFLSADFSP